MKRDYREMNRDMKTVVVVVVVVVVVIIAAAAAAAAITIIVIFVIILVSSFLIRAFTHPSAVAIWRFLHFRNQR